jgi:hypothetical protein
MKRTRGGTSAPLGSTPCTGDAPYNEEVCKWHTRLAEHIEERAGPFVKNGDLALRPESTLYSPNYPGCSCHPKG